MIYMEFEASKAGRARDVVEGDGGEIVAIIDREGVEEGTMVDQCDDVGIACIGGGHEDADVGTDFGDFCGEGFLGSALRKDDDPEVSADNFRNRGGRGGLKIERVVETDGRKVGK